ncbi:Uncharacterized protein APZ42_003003, partial [Daphnia magna]
FLGCLPSTPQKNKFEEVELATERESSPYRAQTKKNEKQTVRLGVFETFYSVR